MEVCWQFPGNREPHRKLPGFLERSVSLTRDNRCVTDRIPEARVLVVDDEPSIVELLSVSLKFQGFEVETASDGAGGLDKARRFRPDAVILDVMMPGMDGTQTFHALRALPEGSAAI